MLPQKLPIATLIASYKIQKQPYNNYLLNLAALASQLRELKTKKFWEDDIEICKHYVYVYLDPRKPGDYKYTCPSGKEICFTHQPFYVGKGKDDRVDVHLAAARRLKGTPGRHGQKLNTIWAIQRDTGKDPERKTTKSKRTDALAMALEIDLIAGIGRKDRKLGPLANGTDGGDGGAGAVRNFTEEHRRNMSKAQKAKPSTSEYTRALISSQQKGKPKPEGFGAKVSAGLKGIKHAPERTARRSERMRNGPIITCDHCGKSSRNKSNMTRWHFDNCRER